MVRTRFNVLSVFNNSGPRCPADEGPDCRSECSSDDDCGGDNVICCIYGGGDCKHCVSLEEEVPDETSELCSTQFDDLGECTSNCQLDTDCVSDANGVCCNYGTGCDICRYPIGIPCKVEKKEYLPGADVPSSDNCNTCICKEDGTLNCTQNICFDQI
ncbi:mucin-5AC [Mactra antiquata]